MAKKKRAPVVALDALLERRFPDIDDAHGLIAQGVVLVDGAPCLHPAARVRADAALKVLRPVPLRGTRKLAYALQTFPVDVRDRVALDVGAAAGGFTQALLDAGAKTVYALDVGVGQLRGHLRVDPRVVNLERTNVSQLASTLLPEPVDVITMDLSYLSIADAVPQLERVQLTPGAELVALVKPTFELHAPELAATPDDLARAVVAARAALAAAGWAPLADIRSPVPGSKGALEGFVHARRVDAQVVRNG